MTKQWERRSRSMTSAGVGLVGVILALACSDRDSTNPTDAVTRSDAGSTSDAALNLMEAAAPLSPEAGTEATVPLDDSGTPQHLDAGLDASQSTAPDADASAESDAAQPTDLPWTCPGDPPQASSLTPAGWASVEGYSLANTVGGLGGQVVSASNPDELRQHAEDAAPKIIAVCGKIRLATRLTVGSHKTLVGVGPDPVIQGGLDLFGRAGAYVQNIIIRDLTIDASTVQGVDVERVSALRMEYAHHVWLDHLEVFNAPRGLIDIVFGSDLVTVSWSKFYFTQDTPNPVHRFGIRIGDTDDASTFGRDGGKLRVTLHHNWFGEYIRQRAPRVTYGQAHIVNNYYSTTGNDTTIWGASQFAHVLIEANYFRGTTNPHEVVLDEMAQVVARDNIYDATTGTMDTNGAIFEPPYDFNITDAADVPEVVQLGAGPASRRGVMPGQDAGVVEPPDMTPTEAGTEPPADAGMQPPTEAGPATDAGSPPLEADAASLADAG